MVEQIKKFLDKRPGVIAAYGYGSGVFKQSGYTSKDKPQIDLILVVDDLKKWHLENIKLNKNDYSMIGKAYFKHSKIDKLKGCTGIAYISNIVEDGSIYKYGTIEEKDLLKYLNTWESFYLPGRFQKTVYPIIENDKLKESINNNRDKALMVASFLSGFNQTTPKDIYVMLCGLSYLGDTRMKFAENPRKVLNIVEGSFDEYSKIYKLDKKYLKVKNELVNVDIEMLNKELSNLPKGLKDYIDKYINDDYEIIREKILEYFEKLNKKESTKQTIKGIYTNGIIRSINYASKKIMKKIKRK